MRLYRQQFIPGISSHLVRMFRRSVFRCYQVEFLDALFFYDTIIVYILSYSTKISLIILRINTLFRIYLKPPGATLILPDRSGATTALIGGELLSTNQSGSRPQLTVSKIFRARQELLRDQANSCSRGGADKSPKATKSQCF